MSETNKILVAVDFSESCTRLLECAAQQAQCSGAQVIIVYAVPSYLQFAADPIPHHYLHKLMEHMADGAKTKMAEMLPQFFPNGVAATHIIEGYPADVILQAARDEQVSMIVMGSHGHHSVEATLLGSVAERVLRKSPVPVLVVRPACEAA